MATSFEPVEALLGRARLARQQGAAEEERRLLDEAVARFPGNPHARNARGMRALGDHDPALAALSFAAAAQADPGEPALRLNLATACRVQGDDAGERAALQQALDIDQLNFTAQLRMAELLQRLGDVSAAVLHWSAVAQLAAGMGASATPAVSEARVRAEQHLADHNASFAAALDSELAQAPTDDEDDRRFNACVDIMLGRRKIYVNQCAGIHYPFLPAEEYFPRRLFPWLGDLEAHTAAIRAEALALLESDNPAIRPYVRMGAGVPETKWSALDNSPDWSAAFLWEYGEKNEAICALCPATAAALAAVPQTRVPGRAPSAFFSILRPHAHIPPHTGVTNTRTIIHLPLVVPDRCTFRVGGETRPWREGEAWAFDDTIEHEAWNESDAVRIILIFDVWNPYLSAQEQANLVKLFTVAERGISAVKPG